MIKTQPMPGILKPIMYQSFGDLTSPYVIQIEKVKNNTTIIKKRESRRGFLHIVLAYLNGQPDACVDYRDRKGYLPYNI
jgi:hypothetical protein